MPFEQQVFDYFLKWFIPFLCAGLFSAIFIPLRNKLKKGQEVTDQTEWDNHAQAIQQQIDNLKNETQLLSKRIDFLQKDVIEKIDENTKGIRVAMLQQQLRGLIIDGKSYLRRGKITIDQLTDYNERYSTYKALGGNGHADIWVSKIRELNIVQSLDEDESLEGPNQYKKWGVRKRTPLFFICTFRRILFVMFE